MRRQSGFTIAEMMLVVLIIGILSAFAVPSMRSLIRTQEVKTISFDIFASLTLARSEALKRNTNVNRKSTRLNSSHIQKSRMPSSA